jgi:cytochrome b pre-mRNA-processing protein 3
MDCNAVEAVRPSGTRSKPMILSVFRRRKPTGTIDALYGVIVAQARLPTFYRDYGIPDTRDARFDMIVLHQVLLARRLARDGEAGRALSQDVFDLFCRDMDANLREMGVGDLTVPKEMQRMAEAFYGRAEAYDRALADPADDALAAALARNVFGQAEASVQARRLARYARLADRELAAAESGGFAQGRLMFPDPDTISAVEQ